MKAGISPRPNMMLSNAGLNAKVPAPATDADGEKRVGDRRLSSSWQAQNIENAPINIEARI
ncbi:MAG: hypothetical protein GEU28_02145 [Dehalococcoidia bacterium]|nr:hypothetical protein [Dehalococcoidia bacterium]